MHKLPLFLRRFTAPSLMIRLLACLILCAASVQASEMSDAWVATDAIGRKLPTATECGAPRKDRTVAIFYLLWMGHHGTDGPYDISKIRAAGTKDLPWGPLHAFHHWGEPELGYYLSDDDWAMRRHVQMLADAGVDALFIDATNATVYWPEFMTLCKVLDQVRKEGQPAPQVAFFAHGAVIQELYDKFYSKGLYPELWFRWEGKPLLLTSGNPLMDTHKAFNQDAENYFTFRKMWGLQRITEPDTWSFLQPYPQDIGWHEKGVPECMSVSIAQQETYMSAPTAHGHSYHNGAEPPPAERDWSGKNFAEQWERALKADPKLIFITGWNEWVAQRFEDEQGNTRFVDTWDEEFNRDIEPMRGGHTDTYYYQMVNYIRRYKGMRTPEPATPEKAIQIDGDFGDWDGVGPTFHDTPFDTEHRAHRAWGAGMFVNNTGRNDIVASKAMRDGQYLYFYAETREPLTPSTDPNWMMLFIDVDADKKTGWEGYDFLVNGRVINDGRTLVQASAGAGGWRAVGEADYRVSGNKLELRVPRALLGGQAGPFEFHWADNIQRLGDISEFFVNGDSAPNRRFNYRYEPAAQPGKP